MFHALWQVAKAKKVQKMKPAEPLFPQQIKVFTQVSQA